MKNFLFLVFLILSNYTFSQTVKALQKAADEAYAQEDYYSAMVHLSDALNIEPDNTNLHFKYAEVCRNSNAYELAEENYTKVKNSETGSQYPLTFFWLGLMKKYLGKYEEAIELFEQFLKIQNPNHPLGRRAKKELEDCNWAKDYQPDENMEVTVEHLPKNVNTDFSEFGGLKIGDTLFYSSHRYEAKVDGKEPQRKISKNLMSVNGAKGRPMKYGFNDAEKLTAHTAFSTDGNRIYFTICNFVNNGKILCELYYREKDPKRNRWQKTPVKLPQTINYEGFTSTQPAIGYDETAKKEYLFFVSDRPGTEGNLDIWYTEVKGKNFLQVRNLTAANTPENDITPYFNNASQTLYFSSEGHQSFGGHDVFKIKKELKFGKPENLGQPINTSYNDLYFSINDEETKAYLSSNRPGSFYLDKNNKTCCYDIYEADILKLEKEEPEEEEEIVVEEVVKKTEEPEEDLVEKSGKETDKPNEKNVDSSPKKRKNFLPNRPTAPNTLEKFLPLPLYFDNDYPDPRTTRTYTKRTYPRTFWKYYDKKQEYIEEFIKPLDNEQSISAKSEIENFFEDKVRLGYDHLLLFSELLLKRLEEGETVEIFIKGYTSPLAKTDYNLNLGKRRVSSLKNHFKDYYDGIFREYLDAGQLVLTEVSFGETKAASNVSDDFYDLRNSIYNVEAAQERRVEIVEIKRD